MVLDTARPRYKENTTWLEMRGRDAARKSTLKVNILRIFTIDFSEIQFMVNHNSQSDGQNNSAKSGMNLQKKIIHINSLQRKRTDTKDNGILRWTKKAKIGLWNFDLILEPLSWWKIVYTTNQENKLKSFSIQINKDDGICLQAHRGGTSLNGIGSELTFFWNWLNLNLWKLVSWTVDSDPLQPTGCEGKHTSHETFSTYLTLCTHHIVAQGVAACVWQNHSCTCHHMFERLLFPYFVFFLSLSRLYFSLTVYLFSVLLINSKAFVKQTKAEGNSLQETVSVPAKWNLKSKKGTKNKDEWSDFDKKGRLFSRSQPSRNVIQRGDTHQVLPTSPE